MHINCSSVIHEQFMIFSQGFGYKIVLYSCSGRDVGVCRQSRSSEAGIDLNNQRSGVSLLRTEVVTIPPGEHAKKTRNSLREGDNFAMVTLT